MKKVIYTYNIRYLECGCCSESANTLEIIDVATGREVYFDDATPTFCCQEELEQYLVESHNMQMCDFHVDSDSEFL